MNYKQLIDAFGEAFNRHDAEGLISMMTEDCTFYTVAGDSEFGNAIEGRDAVKAAFESVWQAMPDAHWQALHSFVDGDDGLAFWRFTGTDKDGARTDAQGCDIFTFRNGKIHIKNAFRKQRPAITS